MGGLTVDLTVRLGDLLTMIGLFAGGLYVVNMQRADLRVLSQRVGSVESSIGLMSDKLNGITVILVEQAKQHQRIQHVEDQLRELRK